MLLVGGWGGGGYTYYLTHCTVREVIQYPPKYVFHTHALGIPRQLVHEHIDNRRTRSLNSGGSLRNPLTLQLHNFPAPGQELFGQAQQTCAPGSLKVV